LIALPIQMIHPANPYDSYLGGGVSHTPYPLSNFAPASKAIPTFLLEKLKFCFTVSPMKIAACSQSYLHSHQLFEIVSYFYNHCFVKYRR
jgi:hypothetical protein